MTQGTPVETGLELHPNDVDLAFRLYCQERILRQGRLIVGAVFTLNLLWWPLDWVVFAPTLPHHMSAISQVRTVFTILSGGFLLFSVFRRAQRWILHTFLLSTLGCCFAAAVGSAHVGGPDVPNFHTLYVGVLSTLPLPIKLHQRIASTAALALAIGIGLFIFTPQHFESKYAALAISFLVFTFVLCTSFGHSQYVLLRDNFYQASQLTEYAKRLESRVAERTEELRNLLANLETARELERTRIARELHDELGQELSALRYALGHTQMRYAQTPLDIQANLEDLEELLRRTAKSTRNLVTDLRPRIIDDLGLGPAVEWLVKRTEARTGLKCHLSLNGRIDNLDDRIAIAAFRMVQEALTNVTRHARASEVQIEVGAVDNSVCLSVVDDGIGISKKMPSQPGDEPTTRVGILGMRERALALGGVLTIGDRAEHPGTEVVCRLPLWLKPATAESEEAEKGGES